MLIFIPHTQCTLTLTITVQSCDVPSPLGNPPEYAVYLLTLALDDLTEDGALAPSQYTASRPRLILALAQVKLNWPSYNSSYAEIPRRIPPATVSVVINSDFHKHFSVKQAHETFTTDSYIGGAMHIW